jgi:hypothetical protein
MIIQYERGRIKVRPLFFLAGLLGVCFSANVGIPAQK